MPPSSPVPPADAAGRRAEPHIADRGERTAGQHAMLAPPGSERPRSGQRPDSMPGARQPASGAPGKRSRLRAIYLALGSVALVAVVVAVISLTTYPSGEEAAPATLPTASGNEQSGGQAAVEREMEALLDHHGQALREGNEQAFVASFAAAVRPSQQRLFRNLRTMPLESVGFEMVDLTGRTSDNFGRGGRTRMVLDVAFVHKVPGVDVLPVAELYRWTVEKETPESPPTVVEVDGSPIADAYYPQPWDLHGRLTVVERPHVVVTAGPDDRASAERMADRLEQAAGDNLAMWAEHGPKGLATPARFMVALEADSEEFAQVFRSPDATVPGESGVAMVMTDHAPLGETAEGYGGARIALHTRSDYFTRLAQPAGLLEVARHEIAHGLVAPLQQRGELQTWVAEGFADYAASRLAPGQRTANEPALRGFPFDGRLPSKDDFDSTDPRRSAANYVLSERAIRYIAERYGEDKALAFVADHYQRPNQLDESLRAATGTGRDEFEAGWAAYVRSTL